MAKHSKHNIGVKAGGKLIKTLYDLTAGAAGPVDEYNKLRGGLNQIRKLANQRIDTLVRMEAKTGYTSPALRALREAGYGGGISIRGADKTGAGLQSLREQYKAMTNFIRHAQSTEKGVREHRQNVEQGLYNAGYRGPRGGHLKLSAEQLKLYDQLAEKFFKEESKNVYYRANAGGMDRETLIDTVNKEISKILSSGDLDSALEMADARIKEINEKGFEEDEEE